jgi:hypothetical protein
VSEHRPHDRLNRRLPAAQLARLLVLLSGQLLAPIPQQVWARRGRVDHTITLIARLTVSRLRATYNVHPFIRSRNRCHLERALHMHAYPHQRAMSRWSGGALEALTYASLIFASGIGVAAASHECRGIA